jgi:histidine decarboxylase
MDNTQKIKNLLNAISPYNEYCDGFGCPGASGNSYVLGLVLGVGKDKIKLSHPGSSVLDEINAFDLAEVDSAYIGQLNMIIVSSFCGPQGLIWGYDIAFNRLTNNITNKIYKNIEGQKVKIFSADSIIAATKSLFGTKENRMFPIKPGSHVPFAGKNYKFEGPKRIYCAIAMGIPENREKNAVLLMEDIGWIPLNYHKKNKKEIYMIIYDNLIRSVLEIGENQNVNYSSILVSLRDLDIKSGEIGCSLVAAPYFTLARNALGNISLNELVSTNLQYWNRSIKK